MFSIFYKAYPSFQERDKYETIHYYKKCEIAIPDIKLTVDPIQPSVYDVANNIEIASAVQQGRNHAQRIVNADPFAYREGTVMKRLREAKTEQEYLGYIESIKGDVVAPPWDFALEIHSKPAGNYHLLQLFLKNTTIENPNELHDSCLFNPKLSVRFEDAQLHPYEFNLLSRDYRYDRELWGVGHNCGVIVSNERNEVKTTLSPIYYQHRYVTRDRVRPAFEGLSADPFPILWSIRREMAAFQTEWENELQRFQRKRSIEEYGECLKDLENFKAEIRRFEAGVQLLEQEPLALEAFRLLNQTFLQKDLQRKSPFASWRMFQIVFIVMLIPDVVSREYPTYKSSMTDKADVIWFPTGGGKTEAYLGLTIFAAFFDRLRGKSSGVTSWIRFPLRLLSIQQFQRIAEIYAEAEKIRLQHPIIGGKEYDCFSVGYFVGEGNTPNQLNKPFIRRFMDDPYFRERYKMIERCPYCGEASISIEIDEFVMRMYHGAQPQCHFDVLPYI